MPAGIFYGFAGNIQSLDMVALCFQCIGQITQSATHFQNGRLLHLLFYLLQRFADAPVSFFPVGQEGKRTCLVFDLFKILPVTILGRHPFPILIDEIIDLIGIHEGQWKRSVTARALVNAEMHVHFVPRKVFFH